MTLKTLPGTGWRSSRHANRRALPAGLAEIGEAVGQRDAASAPDDAWVLETDAPDIPPQWRRRQGESLRNEPGDLPAMAEVMAKLRGLAPAEVAQANRRNACAALPRLAALLEHRA